MNILKETTSLVLLGHIGIQACAVGIGLVHHYSQPQTKAIVLTVEAQRYSMQDILYGAIRKPQPNYPADSQDHTKELSITLVGSTTGSSGDYCTLVFPV